MVGLIAYADSITPQTDRLRAGAFFVIDSAAVNVSILQSAAIDTMNAL
jgi:hypothetical protein